MTKNILFIHQSAELYGSDKTLLLLVEGLSIRKNINPIVLLPEQGPLYDILVKQHITTIVAPVLKLHRKMFSVKNICSLPFQIRNAVRKLDEATKGIKIDLVYSNTLAVLLGFIYAKKKKIQHVWHVHEIIEKPNIVRKIFLRLIASSVNTKIIYNSYATRNFWRRNDQTPEDKSIVVWNGMSAPAEHLNETATFRKTNFQVMDNDIVIALVGRINRWKGQGLLLDVFEKLVRKHNNIKLLFVGSAPPNQEEYLYHLQEKIKKTGLDEKVILRSFLPDIWQIWDAIDIAVVPSVVPESFGLVALEAMLCAKPVIAADHGGLSEIVVDKGTGLLFEPNNANELELALEYLIMQPDKRVLYGDNGYSRAVAAFTLEKYIDQIEAVCLNL